MAESKKINLSKFFRQDSAAPSAVGVRDERGINPQAQVVMSGRDLSEMLSIIQTTTEINTGQSELIRVEDRNDSILQGLVDGLQQRIFGLQSSLSRLQSDFQQDLLSRKKLQDKKERQKFVERAELSKSMSLTQPTQGLVETSTAPAYESGSGDSAAGSVAASIAGGLLGGGGALLGNMLDDNSGSGSGSGASSGQWKPLLDVIASGEGGYNSVNPGQTVDGLTEMTISEAYTKAKEVGAANGGSGAMGRYQLLSDPIGRAKAAGLDPDKDKFSPENQDRIAVHIIENVRNGKDWLTGKIDDKTFSQGIADEWAGVPNIEGKFSHQGQGGKVKAESVKAALKQIKETTPEASTPSAQSQQASSTSSSQTTNVSSTNVQATQVSAAPSQSVEEIASEEKNMASQVAASKTPDGDKAQAITPPEDQMASGAPIVIPVNGQSQRPMQEMQVSSGDAIPGGMTENLNNFYPALSRAVLGIMV